MLRDMQKQAYASASVGLLLGKSKEERAKQRVFFVNLSEAGLQFIRAQMKKHSGGNDDDGDGDGPGLEPEDVPACLRARAAHMAEDPAASGFLEVIFRGANKKARREQLDDKNTRTPSVWKTLSDDYFNNPGWKPENCQTDSRVESINPALAPSEPWEPEKVRTLFSALRTQYSIFNDRYHRSGQIEEGEGDGDDDFFQNFVRGDIVYFYMHLLFKGDPPRYCLRDLDVSQKSDLGCSEESNMSVLSESGKKRVPGGDLTREDFHP
ncbi:hypothetical protein B484DRAFT_403413 [Ochromonadaceae sp. CCMP2298]|nr:hypothetical protein B484DRAFT_403413 [Ochromonadaceae sp. CCMP2298]